MSHRGRAGQAAGRSVAASVLDRRAFTRLVFSATVSLTLPGCGGGTRLTPEDQARLEQQRRDEAEQSGTGPDGPQRYRGYRGLTRLPWFELDERGRLRLVASGLPPAFDVHAHLGISLLLAPDVALLARTPRVRHLLDCDGEEPGCALDLDVYINGNFTPAALRKLRREVAAQLLWGGASAATHTIPNLLDEMDASGVEKALVHPIAFGLPFGDDLTERWMEAIAAAGAGRRLISGASVHPRDPERIEKLERYAERGVRVVKLHPATQRFFPDAPEAMDVYEACGRLGLVVFFHAGRAGIEPTAIQPFNLMRYYEPALERFPDVSFVLGHAGARDVAEAIPMALRHQNAWLDVHGQGVTALRELIDRVGGDRLLFGTDWPFYHPAASLAKILLVTEGRPELRYAMLRGNADRLLGAR